MRISIANITPVMRGVLAMAWTIFLMAMLLKPGEISRPDEFSFHSFISSFFSFKLTVWDMLEINFHIILFAVLTGLWLWVFTNRYGKKKALVIAIGIGFVLGLTTEVAQYFVGRSSRLFDLLANYLGIMLFCIWVWQSVRFKSG